MSTASRTFTGPVTVTAIKTGIKARQWRALLRATGWEFTERRDLLSRVFVIDVPTGHALRVR